MATQLQTTEFDTPTKAVALSENRENYAIMKDKAKNFAMSQLIPDSIRGKSPDEAFANCLIALELANIMGEPPLVVMQNIHIVKGKAGFSAQYMIARANRSGVFEGRINWRESGAGDGLAFTAYATPKDTGEEVSFTCDMAMAKAEGWTSNPKYRSMPALMLRYRSATFLIRLYAPDVMLGYQTTEEHQDMIAASGPAPSALTGAMLLQQAQPLPAHNPDTGEIIEGGRTDEQHGDQFDGTNAQVGLTITEHQANADQIIAAAGNVTTIIDLNNLREASETRIEDMPAEIAALVNAALDDAEMRLKGAK
jgi:hypothetical protein